MKQLIALAMLALASLPFSYAQQSPENITAYGRQIVNDLCAPEMHGRGYVNQGHVLAANYIEEAFTKMGVLPLLENGAYQQPFNMNINTFPGKVAVALNGKKLEPGADFIMGAGSPGTKGQFDVIAATQADFETRQTLVALLKRAAGKYIFLDEAIKPAKQPGKDDLWNLLFQAAKYDPGLSNVAGILLRKTKKLTAALAMEQWVLPVVELHPNAWSAKAPQTIVLDIESAYKTALQSQNVIGIVKGHLQPDSLLMFTAHYDHLGRMGQDIYFPGANDNASGIAMLLAMAKHYANPANKPLYTMVFIAFGGEEAGLLGSRHFVQNAPFKLGQIKALLNLDMLGTGQEGITVVNATVYPKAFKALQDLNQELAININIKPRGEACNSDHCFFYMEGVRAFFTYTVGGIQAYHDVYDRAETLPLTAFANLHKLFIEWLNWLANNP